MQLVISPLLQGKKRGGERGKGVPMATNPKPKGYKNKSPVNLDPDYTKNPFPLEAPSISRIRKIRA